MRIRLKFTLYLSVVVFARKRDILLFSPLYDVLDQTNHIFSEILSFGDENNQHNDLKKEQTKKKKTYVDKYKYKLLQRLNAMYISEKQGAKGFEI